MIRSVAVWTLLWLSLLASAAAACGRVGASSDLRGADCRVLLEHISALSPATTWESCSEPEATAPAAVTDAPEPPRHIPDPAHCQLIDPSRSEIEQCLVEAVTLSTLVPDPRCPKFAESVALGDLAFFMLAERVEGLWVAALPVEVSSGSAQLYHQWVEGPGHRELLQKRVREALGQ